MLINFVSLILQEHMWHVLQEKTLYQNVLWNVMHLKNHRDAQKCFLNTFVIVRAPKACNCHYIWRNDVYLKKRTWTSDSKWTRKTYLLTCLFSPRISVTQMYPDIAFVSTIFQNLSVLLPFVLSVMVE